MPPMPTPHPATREPSRRFSTRHMLMLALALEILIAGSVNADRYRRPGVTVNTPAVDGHVIT
ncbi:hypothetical protein [Methylorubrum zatmanii]|uniref:Uncharacterized protein n=1 Tax=Methylorubrum zatmanii TaxID=29429 RepID=A0ABW1WIT2_9HYPH|nr:hypothetical protein [Methylorubrum zatmanii]